MNVPVSPAQARPANFLYSPMFPLGPREVEWRKLDIAGVSTSMCDGQTVLRIKPEALSELTFQAYRDVSHLLRPYHLRQLRSILDDPEASANDRFVALDLLKNASISAGGVLPMCQDTGTALVFGKKGQRVWVEGDEEEAISYGVHRTYTETNLRYSQMAPLTMFDEVNTGNNLPVQLDINAAPGHEHADEMNLMFIAKGGGSANKFFLFQETRAILTPEKLLSYLETRIKTLGTAACPPYHLSIAIGGTSADLCLKACKLASTKYLDPLPTAGSKAGHAFRDVEMERQVLELTRKVGIGAQFGGKYFCHDVRVIRMPRHGASLPVAIGVSCSADRQILGEDHAGGGVPRAIGNRSVEIPARGRGGRRRGRADRSEPADGGDSANAVAVSGQDSGVAERADDRGAGHRACEVQGAAGSGRGSARLSKEPPGLLCRTGEDPGGDADRQLRADDGGTDG